MQAKRSRDDQDWRLFTEIWKSIDREFGPFCTDACVDLHRSNSFCFNSWNEEDDARAADWHGRNVWCNPPFRHMLAIIRRFLECKIETPSGTTACFLLPVWTQTATKPVHPAYQFVTSHPQIFHEVRHFPQDTLLFSAPSDLEGGRTIWGGVRWPVKVFHVKPCPLPYNPLTE